MGAAEPAALPGSDAHGEVISVSFHSKKDWEGREESREMCQPGRAVALERVREMGQ